MKKLLVMLLIAALTFTMIGCGSQGEAKEETAKVEVNDAVEILTAVWDNFDESSKFPIGGGGYENMTMDVPGAIDPADTDSLTGLLAFPADSVELIDDAASMMHMMNANTFTAGAYHVVDAANQQALADELKDSIVNTQWICGFPEVMVIAGVNDDYVVTVIGNGELAESFKTQLTELYGAEILHEENLM